MCDDGSKGVRYSGSVYLYVLASSMLIATVGLGSMYAVRIQMRSTRLARDQAEARACAVSAVELGLLHVQQDPNWRTAWPDGAWLSDEGLGTGSFTLQGIDPVDGALSDSEYEPLVLTGIGVKGIARHKTQVTLVPDIEPLEALNACLHASDSVHIRAGKSITVVGGPISTNGQLDNEGTIDGSVEAQSVNRTGTITGTLMVPAPTKRMPATGVVADYISRATVVPYSGTIDKQVLGPGCNPWGPTDPNGLYFIDTQDNDLTIRNSRIYGTLIVRTTTKRLILDDSILIQSCRPDFPALIVEGNAAIQHHSFSQVLSESAEGTNFNPVGAAYLDASDEDLTDQYPNEIQGLVHITGSLVLKDTARINGAVICEGSVSCEETNTIIYMPSLSACPPEGYTYAEQMRISPGSWRRVVD